MKYQTSRRDALKLAAAGLATSAIGCSSITHSTPSQTSNTLAKPVRGVLG